MGMIQLTKNELSRALNIPKMADAKDANKNIHIHYGNCLGCNFIYNMENFS